MNRRLDGCDFCGLTPWDFDLDLDDDLELEVLFDVSEDGKTMACMGCSVGREGFYQWEVDL